MATLTVTESTDYSATSLTNIGTIDFVNTADAATATFSRSQFGAGLIRNNVLIDGSSAANVIAVVGGTINASAWQFANWRDVADRVVLTGSDNPETIVGSIRGDAIEGKGGDDELSGGDGNDRIRGGGGNDIIDGGTGRNILYGGLGNDTLTGGSERNDLYGQDGDDLISSFYRGAIDGGTGTDRLTLVRQPGSANLTIDISLGGEGADIGDGTMIAGIESFFVQSGVGNDTVRGGDLADWIETGQGDDIIDGRGGNDTLLSGAGYDTVSGGGGDDSITSIAHGSFDGGKGMDDLSIFRTNTEVALTFDLMTLVEDMGDGTRVDGFEKLTYQGGRGVDIVFGGNYVDYIWGGDGNDIIDGRGGSDHLNGGIGRNTLSYASSGSAMLVSLKDAFAEDGKGVKDAFVAFRCVLGSSFDDRITGDKKHNTLNGGDGNDQLHGLAASDVLWGGTGNDLLLGDDGDDRLNGGSGRDAMNGGAGVDIFAFTAASDSETGLPRDWIGDFAAGIDIIDLSAIDADETGGTSNDGFSFVAGAGTPFADSVPGQVRFEFISGNTIISISTDADADAESQIELYGEINLSAGDFLL